MASGIRKFVGVGFVAAFVVAVAVAIFAYGQGQPQKKGFGRRDADAPVPVKAEPAKLADKPVYLDGVGTTRALKTVTVTSLVDGTLLSVDYHEGQDVKKGDVLARVDPTTYQAQLDQVAAKKALDQAQLANAKVDLERYTNLVKTNAVTKQQVDTQRAQIAQLEAQVKLDQGAIDAARALVNWCTIVSPIDGRTGIRLVDEGNVVHGSNATGIVVVTTIKPIAILFTLPQQQLGQVNAAFAKGKLPVLALGPDNKTVVDRGTLQVVNNQVDQTTGTIQLKAEFPNADLQLWPGQFINVRLLVDTLRQVVVAPVAAVQRGPDGTFVYVVQADQTASMRPVTVRQQDEAEAVIADGLAADERVVTSGFSQLSDKRKVEVAPPPGSEPTQPAGRPDGKRRPGAGRTSEASPSPAP